MNYEGIQRFPMLDRQEEYLLARRWREAGDGGSAQKLVTSHLRLVAKIARAVAATVLPIADVISEGHCAPIFSNLSSSSISLTAATSIPFAKRIGAK